jgi:hypothetical protein
MSTKQAVAALVRQAFALRLITQVYPHHHQDRKQDYNEFLGSYTMAILLTDGWRYSVIRL